MSKKTNNRVVLALVFILAVLAGAFVVKPLWDKREEQKQMAKEEAEFKKFFTWRSK